MSKLTVVGSINADLIVHAERHPQPGETLLGSGGDILAGGKGANQAVAAAQLGATVAFVGAVGSDPYAEPAMHYMRTSGIDLGAVEQADTNTGLAVITVSADGENTIVIDCDVLQADGGTRTAAITGAYVALADAIEWGRDKKFIGKNSTPLLDSVSAVSVGIVDGEPMLDLAYVEDVRAETDMNVVVTGRGLFVEVQGTGEGATFPRSTLDALLDAGGIA